MSVLHIYGGHIKPIYGQGKHIVPSTRQKNRSSTQPTTELCDPILHILSTVTIALASIKFRILDRQPFWDSIVFEVLLQNALAHSSAVASYYRWARKAYGLASRHILNASEIV